MLGQIKAGEKYSCKLVNVEINRNNEGQFSLQVYTQGKVFLRSWGFHDYGQLALNQEEFFIYNNGFGYKDKALQKPNEFKVYFTNLSDNGVDSFYSDNSSIIQIYESTPRNFHITYDYEKIERKPVFNVRIGGKTLSKSLTFHDFQNWNDPQAILHFERDTLSNAALPWREPLEFIVDLDVKIPDSLSSITIESPGLIKVYDYYKPKYKRIVFDFKKLKGAPIVFVNVQGKQYLLDLSKHDFSNIYLSQDFYFLEPNGIRSLTDD